MHTAQTYSQHTHTHTYAREHTTAHARTHARTHSSTRARKHQHSHLQTRRYAITQTHTDTHTHTHSRSHTHTQTLHRTLRYCYACQLRTGAALRQCCGSVALLFYYSASAVLPKHAGVYQWRSGSLVPSSCVHRAVALLRCCAAEHTNLIWGCVLCNCADVLLCALRYCMCCVLLVCCSVLLSVC